MNQLTSKPSNSSSEICFFIKNISQTNPREYKDMKNKILTHYIAITDDERVNSKKYNKLINSTHYMHLNQTQKLTIQLLQRKLIDKRSSTFLFSYKDACAIKKLPQYVQDNLPNKHVIFVDETVGTPCKIITACLMFIVVPFVGVLTNGILVPFLLIPFMEIMRETQSPLYASKYTYDSY